MTFRPALWFPIAVVLSVINLAAAGFAAAATEPRHATTHAVLAVAFGLWAQHLRQGLQQRSGGGDLEARLEALELEVSEQRRELTETQERVDFAERLLAQGQEARRVEPER
jgi:hypothetical protein